jgi:hypothetical protein
VARGKSILKITGEELMIATPARPTMGRQYRPVLRFKSSMENRRSSIALPVWWISRAGAMIKTAWLRNK